MFFLLLKNIFINTGTGGFHGERSRRFVSSISRLIFNADMTVNLISSGCMKGSRKDKTVSYFCVKTAHLFCHYMSVQNDFIFW